MPETTVEAAPEATAETTTDFELLQQALKPLRETIDRLSNLSVLLSFQSHGRRTVLHAQRDENVRHFFEELEGILFRIQESTWQSMRLSPITLTIEDHDHWQACRVCGCTESDACPVLDTEGCSWTESDLCSVCAELPCSREASHEVDAVSLTEAMSVLLAFQSGEITIDEATSAIRVENQELLSGLRDLIQAGKKLAKAEAERLKKGE